jgi:hypothetical protein
VEQGGANREAPSTTQPLLHHPLLGGVGVVVERSRWGVELLLHLEVEQVQGGAKSGLYRAAAKKRSEAKRSTVKEEAKP